MNKKASHVGVVLSFVIFVTFIIFLWSIFQPLTEFERGKQDTLDYLQVELIREFAADMTAATITLSSPYSGCLLVDITEGVEKKAVVKDKENNLLNYDISDDKIGVDLVNNDFFKIYYSGEFEDDSISIGGCSEDPYDVGLVRTTEEIFETKIKNLSDFINEGEDNYEEIKQRLKLAIGDEFGFTFKNGSNDFIAGTEEKDISVNIYVEEIPIQYIDSKANINPGFLSIRVW